MGWNTCVAYLLHLSRLTLVGRDSITRSLNFQVCFGGAITCFPFSYKSNFNPESCLNPSLQRISLSPLASAMQDTNTLRLPTADSTFSDDSRFSSRKVVGTGQR